MPGGAATTAGTALTQWVAVATTPGLRARPAAIESGCQPRNVTRAVGSPVTSTSNRSPSAPNPQAGSRSSWPMNQLVATVTTGPPRTVATHRNYWAAMRPGWIGPIGEMIGAVATATSWETVSPGSRPKPRAWPTIRMDWPNPSPRMAGIMDASASSGVLPNNMMLPTTSGAS